MSYGGAEGVKDFVGLMILKYQHFEFALSTFLPSRVVCGFQKKMIGLWKQNNAGKHAKEQ